MQDLQNEMIGLRETLNKAIEELKKRGINKAQAEKDYRVALCKEILKQRDAGMPVSIISDICRGNEEIAKLKFNRDVSESLYESCLQKIYATKLEMDIVAEEMKAERKGE